MNQETVTIRAATDADLEAIVAIQRASPEAAQWQSHDYLLYECRVAVAAHRVIGFMVWRTVAPQENEILNLAVRAENRRGGVAGRLIKFALEFARGTWFLEVRESNTVARKFYERMGFAEVGIRPSYYDNPLESGIVMSFCS